MSDLPRSIIARCTYRSEWRSPWKQDKVRRSVMVTRWPLWVRLLRGKTGVYLIRDAESKDLLYVGRGTVDLKKALVRHFHQWGEDRRGVHRRAVFDRHAVEVKVYLVRREWVVATEADLIALWSPRENRREERANATRYGDIPF